MTTKYYKRGTVVHAETYDPNNSNGTGGNDPYLTGPENEARFWQIRDGKNSNWGYAIIQKPEYDILKAFAAAGGAQQGNPNAETQKALKAFSDNYNFTANVERTYDPQKSVAEATARFFADPANVSTSNLPATPTANTSSASTYTKNGVAFDPSKYTNLTPGTQDFDNYLKENGITKSGGETKAEVVPASNFLSSSTNVPTTPQNLNKTPLGNSGVNSLFKLYYGRDATQDELNYWATKSDAELRPKLIPNSAVELERNKKTTTTPAPATTVNSNTNLTTTNTLNTTPLGNSGVNALFKLYYGRDATSEELNYWSAKSDSELRPKLIPNSATELERNKQANTSDNNFTADTENTAGNETSIYDNIINGDAFLSEQFKDQTIKDNFAKLSPALQMSYIQMMQSLGKQVEAGKVVNPNIDITPDKVKEFTDQAFTELDPYYQEQIKNYKQDLDTSISRLTEDFNTGVRNAEEPFKRNLSVQAETEAQAGTVYGSERGVRESINVSNQQQLIDEASKVAGRAVEDTYTTAERTLGSDVLGGITAPSLANYKVSNTGIQQSGDRKLFAPTGGLIGSLQKEKTTAIKGRASELEEAYRKQRILNTSQL